MTDFDPALYPEYRQIKLTQGYYVIVDAENYEWLSQWKWHASVDGHTVYAMRYLCKINGTKKFIAMHRQIMQTPKEMKTDHRNGDGLVNIYENLRVCTDAENKRNQRLQAGKSSKFKGVTWNKLAQKWKAHIRHNGELIYLGYFSCEKEAALAYNVAAIKYHGEFARLNNVDGDFESLGLSDGKHSDIYIN